MFKKVFIKKGKNERKGDFMKKVISLILSMAMVLSLTVLSFAAEGETTPTTYSITINNSTEGHTYEAYQIFTGDLSDKTLSNIKWGSGVSANGQSELGDAATKAGTLKTEENAKDFAKEVAPYLTTAAGSTSTVTGGKYVINGLAPGYYLIKDKDESLAGKDDAYTSYILEVVKNVTVDPKSAGTTSQKKVKDTNDSTGETTDWQDSADYDIGDKVSFELKGVVADNYSSYKVYKFAFHDKMSAGLTFDKNSVKVYVDGNEVKSGYEVVTTGFNDGCTFEVRFANLKDIGSVHAGSAITVEYEATLNENAVLGSKGNPNTSYLEYSNNPNDEQGGETGKTPEDTVIVFTYKVVINKVDSDKQPLANADFTLEKYNKEKDKWEAVTVVKNEAGTSFTFKGLDDGNYRLTETKTPDGYNTIDPIEFKVTAGHDILADNPQLTSLNGEAISGSITLASNVTEGSLSADIVNNKGTELPSTGGIGTTIFYVVGAVLVIGAGVLFVTKRRMSTR